MAYIDISFVYISYCQGKSLFFEVFLWIGYAFGIARKIILTLEASGHEWTFWLSFVFYVLNMVEITIDICLYFRNAKLDKARDAGEIV